MDACGHISSCCEMDVLSWVRDASHDVDMSDSVEMRSHMNNAHTVNVPYVWHASNDVNVFCDLGVDSLNPSQVPCIVSRSQVQEFHLSASMQSRSQAA